MSEKKNKRIKFKGLFIAAACLAALLCGTLTANAATDGALFEGLQLIVNGEEVNLSEYIKNYKSYVRDDGAVITEYEIDVPEENGSAAISIEEEFGNSGEKITEQEKTDDHSATYKATE